MTKIGQIKYQSYNSKKRGSKEEWILLANRLKAQLSTSNNIDKQLKIMGLKKMPKDLSELKKIRKVLMFKNHPDKGGSQAKTTNINLAFEILKKEMEKK